MGIIVEGTALDTLKVGSTDIQKVYAREGEAGEYILVFEKSNEPVIWFVGNWKMNMTKSAITQFFGDLSSNLIANSKKPIWICPPACYLKYTVDAIPAALKDRVKVGAQNICLSTERQSGAYTGQISAAMVKDCGCSFVLVGQDEVRRYLSATVSQTQIQIESALAQGLDIVFCVGETDTERDAGQTQLVLESQLAAIAGFFPSYSSQRFYIVYEPVWAFGTGRTCTPSNANDAINIIQNWLTTTYSLDFKSQGFYLFGGGVTASNVNTFLQQVDELNGPMVAGRSLSGSEFANIINTASK